MNQLIKTSAKYGLIFGGISIAFSMLIFLLEVNMLSIGFGIFNFIFSIALLVAMQIFAIREYRNRFLEGYINYGKAFLTGVFASAFAAILSAIYSFIFFSAIDPGYFDQMVNEFMSKLASNPDIPAEQIDMIYEKTMEAFRKPPAMQALNALLYGVISGSIVGLIVSIFTKKERPLFE